MATQTPVMHQNHHNSNSYTHRPHAQSSSSMGAGAGTAGLYDDPTAWHSPSPFATTPSSLPHVSLGSVGTGAGTSVSPVESKHKSRIGAQSTSPEIIKKAHGQALGLTQTHDINGSRVILTSSSSSPSEYGIGLGSGNRNNNLKGKEARLGGGSSLKEGSDQVLLGLSSNGDEKDYQT
ncbi:hypothetical protein I317_04950 [Kwoniella heveanensis CBS 569]|nr:hypothetical protein I317_04950 [Kwoniella heveanensis CBS 569]